MTHEYDDPVSNEKLDRAARLILRRYAEMPATSLETLAIVAVQEVFCTCVTGSEDAAEQHPSEIHAALVVDALQRAHLALNQQAVDAVDLASEQSFPASDPPGWIWERR